MAKELRNKPLVEALIEIRWNLQGPANLQTDPHYKLLLGRLFDRVMTEYPAHEQLATASIPDELVGQTVQHRFRVAANSWPLVQIGPGIFTVNSTQDYTWSDFRPRAIAAVGKLYEAHPKPRDLKISSIILRYIDTVEFDYTASNTFDFLKDKLKINISLDPKLFEDVPVTASPAGVLMHASFKTEDPRGLIILRVGLGQTQGKPAVVWETLLESNGDNVPNMPTEFEAWIDSAHQITGGWFFKMIEGDLERRFDGN